METEYNFLTIDDTTKICDDIYIRPDITIKMKKKINKNYWNIKDIQDLIKNYNIAIQLVDDFSGYKKVPCYTNQKDSSDFPPPKVSAGWLYAHIHCLYHFVKEISDNNYQNRNVAKFEDGHLVQLVLESIN